MSEFISAVFTLALCSCGAAGKAERTEAGRTLKAGDGFEIRRPTYRAARDKIRLWFKFRIILVADVAGVVEAVEERLRRVLIRVFLYPLNQVSQLSSYNSGIFFATFVVFRSSKENPYYISVWHVAVVGYTFAT